MKTNKKALELVEKGLSAKTVSKLTEGQINTLYSKIILSEQTQPQIVNKNVKQIVLPPGSETTVGSVSVSNKGGKTTVTPTTEQEMEEDVEVDSMDSQKGERSQDPKQVGPSSDDGFDDYNDGTDEFSEEKEMKNNPWAICTASVGRSNKRKYERCVKDVKKSLKEGKNPLSLFLESEIMRIVEKHIPPKIKKGDLMKFINENSPTTAPSKPKTKPTTKPGKPDVKPSQPSKPSHPFKNPNPGEKEVPKAKRKETNEAGPAIAPSKPKTEPTTKPGKPGVKPSNPVKPAHPLRNPNPGEKEVPKAVSPEDAKDKVIDVIMNILQK